MSPEAPLREQGFAANRPTGPRTRDGHALAVALRKRDTGVDWDAWIRTIEDQATLDAARADSLDVGRLARAIERSEAARGLSPHIVPGGVAAVYLTSATLIAAEYARLASPETEPKP